MRSLSVPRRNNNSPFSQPAETLGEANWPDANTCFPEVCFQIEYDACTLYLRFEVNEPRIRATNTEPNSPVWEDSCVEMFLATSPDSYVNFEFNCIGTALASTGSERNDRDFLPDEAIHRISTGPSLGKAAFEERTGTLWSLEVDIPFSVLGLAHNQVVGQSFRANFYKCGDGLSTPHYLSWNRIDSPYPDFHRPGDFGTIIFEPPQSSD